MWLNIALCAAAIALSLSAVAIATACYFACRAAMRRSGTASLRAELDEIRDAFEKNSALLKRINQRTVMQERRAAPSDSPVPENPTEWKARMRRELALGHVRHRE